MVQNDKADPDPQTGALFLIPSQPVDPEETFVLVPVIDEPGEFIALFSDGSYTRWIPTIRH